MDSYDPVPERRPASAADRLDATQGLPESHQAALRDEAVEETFPASDPVSPMICR